MNSYESLKGKSDNEVKKRENYKLIHAKVKHNVLES